jgi:hypothetical protein
MLITGDKTGHIRPIPPDEPNQGKDKNQPPWIRKYLDLADKLMKRDKRKDKDKKDDDDRDMSRAA